MWNFPKWNYLAVVGVEIPWKCEKAVPRQSCSLIPSVMEISRSLDLFEVMNARDTNENLRSPFIDNFFQIGALERLVGIRETPLSLSLSLALSNNARVHRKDSPLDGERDIAADSRPWRP